MNVLLTGASGFLGSYLAEEFAARGYNVIAVVRESSNLSRIQHLLGKVETFTLEEGHLGRLFTRVPTPLVVVHAATCYGREGETDTRIFGSNLLFPMELMERAAAAGLKAFVNVDTFFPSLYEALPGYALSKKQFLQWGDGAANRLGTCLINLRMEHLYGPRDDPWKFIPSLIRQCLSGTSEVPMTEGRQKRDFVYATDAAAAFSTVLAAVDRFGPGTHHLGVGSGVSVPIKEVAGMIRDATDTRAHLNFGALPLRENELMDSVADNSGLRRLGWKPEVGLAEGIARTVAAFRGEGGAA